MITDQERRGNTGDDAEPQGDRQAGEGDPRVDVIGEVGGVYPASAQERRPPPETPAHGMASFGQGERGAAGYEDHGESEPVWVPPDDVPPDTVVPD
ncbi:MAG: hypothetical protein QOF33_2614 [Thermomicrobiales bacterium]|jgi:hypothetical protein|nr:hypothetical protein [Thermomicrobiales bacterium]MEA2584529.1 hypothetical protein [Thermomicrobiales bacterium]